MTLRPFFAILIALAMLFAPFAIRSGSAMAATSTHHGETMSAEHCGEQEGDADQSNAQPCCGAMCAAVAVAGTAPVEPLGFASAAHRPAHSHIGPSFVAKLPLPPPRSA